MTTSVVCHVLATGGMLAAFALVPPDAQRLAESASWPARPVLLPFAWQSLVEAERAGDDAEAFARAQHLMRLLPQWADGFAAFAFRYVLAEPATVDPDDARRAARVHTRLQVAIAWLERARALAGRHEPSLLQALAFLPVLAERREPALATLLPPGGAAAIADHYFEEAERLFPSAAAREARTFHAPVLAAALLAAGHRANALDVLQLAIERSRDVRDQQLATEWRTRLQEVVRWLGGDRTVDLEAVRADTRMQPLLPHLR